MSKVAALLIAASMLSGCGVSPTEVGSGEFDPHKVAYFKDDRADICYAVASYSRFDTSGRQAGGLSHASVPCTPAVEKLIRR